MNSEDKPLVTVITLSYKKYKYIYETIKSVLNQDYENIQYIIADDGATNCPESDIKEYVERYSGENIKEFKLLTRKKNVGTVKNLNGAVKMADGDYIIHLSADDVFYDSRVVSRIVKGFKERKCDVLGLLRLRCDEKLEPIRYMPAKFYQRRIAKWDTSQKQYEAFITECFYEMASGSVLSYSKEYWDNNPFDEAYVLWEDGPFIADYLRAGNFLQLDYSFVAIYYREGGISTSGVSNHLLEKDYKLYTQRRYDDVEKSNLSFVSKRIIMRDYEALSDKGIKSRIKRNIKYFYLIPMKIYYYLERWLVYHVEMVLMKIKLFNW